MNILFKKVFKRLRKVFVKIIPFNWWYQPNGFYKTIDDYIASVVENDAVVIDIYPASISESNIPQEFLDKCTKFNELPAVASIPASKLVAIPKGRLYTDSVQHVSIITSDNKVLGDVTYQNKPSNRVEQNVLLKQKYFIPLKQYKGVVFHTLIGGAGSTNYFHWFIDSLARIHLLKKSGWYEKVDWFLVPSFKAEYQKASLQMLGIDENKIIEADKETHIRADVLLATTYVRYFEHLPLWCCNFLRDNFLKPKTFTNSYTHPFVYISRKDANRRLIVNETELLKLLDEYGFKSYELTSLSFKEKIELFHNAEVVVGTLGAGHTNLVFSNKGTDVLEIIPEVFAFPDYYHIAETVGLNYDYILSKSVTNAKTVNQRIASNIIVDLNVVRQKLDKIMMKHKLNKHRMVSE